MITKLMTLALAALLCVSTAGVTASGEMESQRVYQKVNDHFGDWNDDFHGGSWDDRGDDGWDDDWGDWAPPDPASVKLINSKQWAVSGISTIEATYGTDCITVSPSPTQEILLKEYLSEDSPTYDAKTSVSNSTLKIEAGARPQSTHTGYISRIELFIPSGFNGVLKLTTKTGVISISGISVSTIRTDSQNGSVNISDCSATLECETSTGIISLNKVSAPTVTANSKNGSISVLGYSGTLNCETSTGIISIGKITDSTVTIRGQNGSVNVTDFSGTLDIETTTGIISIGKTSASKVTAKSQNGSINVTDFSGTLDAITTTGVISVVRSSVTGTIHAQNGDITLSLITIPGTLDVFTKIGSISAELPQAGAYTVSASTNIGTITNDFTDMWKVTSGVNSAALAGTWGDQATGQISLVTNNGSIKIRPAEGGTK